MGRGSAGSGRKLLKRPRVERGLLGYGGLGLENFGMLDWVRERRVGGLAVLCCDFAICFIPMVYRRFALLRLGKVCQSHVSAGVFCGQVDFTLENRA